MKIHFCSDLHLEFGPYEIPKDLEYDALVIAGDMSPNFQQVIDFCSNITKPIICVFGNHDFWGVKNNDLDFNEKLTIAKKMTKGTNIHLLNNDAIVIDGVRFIGTTLWTNVGEMNANIFEAVSQRLNDYKYISSQKWFESKKNKKDIINFFKKNKYYEDYIEGILERKSFSPFIANSLFKKAVSFLDKELSKEFNGETVVITHHAPTLYALQEFGINEFALKKENWSDLRVRGDEAYKIGGYASDLDWLIWKHRHKINIWAFGHLHKKMDFIHKGVHFVCNPRGYHVKPLNKSDVNLFGFLGYRLNDSDIEKSVEAHKQNPFRGDVYEFDERFVVSSRGDFEEFFNGNLNKIILEQLEIKEILQEIAVELKKEMSPIQTKALQEMFLNNFNNIRDNYRKFYLNFIKEIGIGSKFSINNYNIENQYDLFALSENVLFCFDDYFNRDNEKNTDFSLKAFEFIERINDIENELKKLIFHVQNKKLKAKNVINEILKLGVKDFVLIGWIFNEYSNIVEEKYCTIYIDNKFVDMVRDILTDNNLSDVNVFKIDFYEGE